MDDALFFNATPMIPLGYNYLIILLGYHYLMVLLGYHYLINMSWNPSVVVHPIASLSIRTQRNAQKAIVVTWISIMILCLPSSYYHREHANEGLVNRSIEVDGQWVLREENMTVNACHFDNDFPQFQATYQLVFFMFSFVIPILLIFALYVLMLKRLWFGAVPGCQMSSESVRSKVSNYEVKNSIQCSKFRGGSRDLIIIEIMRLDLKIE